MVNIQKLIDDLKCFETVRDLRWTQGETCPHCDSARITKQVTKRPSLSGSALSAKPVRHSSMT